MPLPIQIRERLRELKISPKKLERWVQEYPEEWDAFAHGKALLFLHDKSQDAEMGGPWFLMLNPKANARDVLNYWIFEDSSSPDFDPFDGRSGCF